MVVCFKRIVYWNNIYLEFVFFMPMKCICGDGLVNHERNEKEVDWK